MDNRTSGGLRALALLAARRGISLIITSRAPTGRGYRARAYHPGDCAKDFEATAPTLLAAVEALTLHVREDAGRKVSNGARNGQLVGKQSNRGSRGKKKRRNGAA